MRLPRPALGGLHAAAIIAVASSSMAADPPPSGAGPSPSPPPAISSSAPAPSPPPPPPAAPAASPSSAPAVAPSALPLQPPPPPPPSSSAPSPSPSSVPEPSRAVGPRSHYYFTPPPPPPTLPYRSDLPVPEGYHVQTRVSRGLVISGAVLAGNAYLLSVAGGLAAVTDNNGDDAIGVLVIPYIGPFLATGIAKTASLSKSSTSGNGGLLILDGLAQIGGSVLFILGMATERRVVVRNDLASTSSAPELLLGPTSAGVRLHF